MAVSKKNIKSRKQYSRINKNKLRRKLNAKKYKTGKRYLTKIHRGGEVSIQECNDVNKKSNVDIKNKCVKALEDQIITIKEKKEKNNADKKNLKELEKKKKSLKLGFFASLFAPKKTKVSQNKTNGPVKPLGPTNVMANVSMVGRLPAEEMTEEEAKKKAARLLAEKTKKGHTVYRREDPSKRVVARAPTVVAREPTKREKEQNQLNL